MDYVFGYGSLMSEYSRQTYSGIYETVTSATLTGWRRSWCTTYVDEGATYAGALRGDTHQLDGVLIPTVIDSSIKERERGYKFTRLNTSDLSYADEGEKIGELDQVWICETLIESAPSETAPLPQSYIDTCLNGCINSQGKEGARRFIEQTSGWNSVWVNDRSAPDGPIYPRFTPISNASAEVIDSLLEQAGVLKYRRL